MKNPLPLGGTALTLLLGLSCIGAAAAAGAVYGRGAFFLVAAGSGLLLTIWLFWQSTQSLTGDAPLTLEEAIGLGAPSAEEERKQAVLRVLKDLEYERAVGKIEEKDFQELSRKYRAEARALLATLDEELGPARKRAETLLEKRLLREAERAAKPSIRTKKASRKARTDETRTPDDSPSTTTASEKSDADPTEREAKQDDSDSLLANDDSQPNDDAPAGSTAATDESKTEASKSSASSSRSDHGEMKSAAKTERTMESEKA